MDKWWHQPLVVVANLPLIVAAGRWNWLSGVRLANLHPAGWNLDAEIMWLLVAAACFGLNVANLLVIYRQDSAVASQPRYRQASWLLVVLIMAGLVVCWAQPVNLLNPRRLTGILVAATILVTAQGLVGNYFLQAVAERASQPRPSLTLPTLTWLAAALLGWPRQLTAGAAHWLAVVVALSGVALLLGEHAVNLKVILTTMGSSAERLYLAGAGAVLASWLSAVVFGLYRCWMLVLHGWPDLLSLVLTVDLLLLAAASQFLAVLTRKLPPVPARRTHRQWSWRPLLLGAVLVVACELAVALLVTVAAN